MFIFCLYAFFSPTEKGITGGTISNYFLITTVARYEGSMVIAPNISQEVANELEAMGIRYSTAKFGSSGLLARTQKRRWLKLEMEKAMTLHAGRATVIASTGTADFVVELALARAIPVGILVRAFEDFYFRKAPTESLSLRFKKLIFGVLHSRKTTFAYRNAAVVVNSEFMGKEVERYFRVKPWQTIYPCIDLPAKDFSCSLSNFVIGMINPSKAKGEALFLELVDHFADIQFVYFGSKERNYTQPNVAWLGWSNDREHIFSKMSLLLVPSLWDEPFGRVGVEAVRNGIPALVSAQGGLPETVASEFVVLDNTCAAWIKKIDWMIENPVDVEHAWAESLRQSEKFTSQAHDDCVEKFVSELKV